MVSLREGGDVVAFASCGATPGSSDDHAGHLYALYVQPPAWSRGIGSTLLREAEERLRGAGCERAELWVQKENGQAHSFYERRGWTLTGKQRANDRGTFLLSAKPLL